jgi:predicted enzyme related to lactoylglutathione lyase
MSALDGLAKVILYVRDMDAQVQFYRDRLGLAVKQPSRLSDYSQEFWVEFDTGACSLVLHGGGQGRLGEDSPKLAFNVHDIQATREGLVQAGVQLGAIRSPAPGIFVCDGLDPEGNRFSIDSHSG